MKKLAIILVSILGVGILLVGIGIIVVVTNPEKFGSLSDGNFEEKQLTEEREVTSFMLDLGADAVEILPSDDGKLSITYYESKRNYWEYSYNDGKATFKQKSKGWFFFGFDLKQRPKVKIYLPDTVTDTLDIDMGSGSLSTDLEKLTLKNLKVDVGSGALSIANVETDDCDIDVSSGAMSFYNITANSLFVNVASGTTKLEKCTANTVDIDVSSGTFKMDNLTANNVSASLSSGIMKISLNGTLSDYRVKAKASSGSVTVKENGEKVSSGDDIYCGSGDRSVTVSISSGTAVINLD